MIYNSISPNFTSKPASISTRSGNLSILRIFLLGFFIFCAGIAQAQVSASFTADDTAGCAPLVVHFTNTSTGATSYSWDIGLGSTYSLTDVSGTYGTVGSYTVTLTAYNGTASSTYSMVIRAYAPPTVTFSTPDTAVCPGSAVPFSSTVVSGSWGGVTYNWNFGDGLSDATATPTHTYALPGRYNVTLFATNSKGCESSLARASYIHVFTPATVAFTAAHTTFCKPNAVVAYTNSTTGAATLSYAWSFGDGATSAITSPTHTYTLAGSYNVKLRVTDGKGCVDSLTYPGYINVGSIHAAFTPTTNVCPGTLVNFHNTSTAFSSSTWSFGDGSPVTTTSDGSHIYTAGGTYNVRLIVFDGSCYDTVTHPITIYPSPATTFNITPSQPCPPPAALTFSAVVAPGSTVTWDFGDLSAPGTGTSVTHTYALSQMYTINMYAVAPTGCMDTITKIDTLYNLYVNPSFSPGEGCAPLTVNFSSYNYSVVYDPAEIAELFFTYPYATSTYTWNFGDGSPTSASPTPTHIYTAQGVYPITCTIHTINGCTEFSTDTVRVGSVQHPSFTASATNICADRSITFRSRSTDSTLIDLYTWGFGDGTDTVANHLPVVVHNYTTTGTHTVSLSVGYNGCFSTNYYVTDTVQPTLAVLHFGYNCSPAPLTTVAFADYSVGDTTHFWTFGDGATSTSRNPVHNYATASTYPVTLTTFNSVTGCRDTTGGSVYLAKPYIAFNAVDTTLCRDQLDTIISTVFRGDTSSAPDAYGDYVGARRYRWYIDSVYADSSSAAFLHAFHTNGRYSISLVITDNHGCLDTLTKTNYLTVAKPIDSFSYTPSTACGPVTAHFIDHTTDLSGVAVTSYFWTFGDGTPGALTSPFPAWLYTAQGAYTVQEITRDAFGCSDTFQNATPISVYKPTASFTTGSYVVCGGTSIHFTNTSTGIARSLWLFGDGGTSTVTSPNHIFTVPGTYTVKLVVFDTHSCASDTFAIGPFTVNPYPVSSFHMTDSFAVCAPLNVDFINTSTGATSYNWIFGDGTSSSATTPSDAYLSPGYYTVQLITNNSYGCMDTALGHVNLFGYTGAFTYTPTSGCSPLSVHFSATISSVTSLTWDFNDGTTSAGSTSSTATHVYVVPGEYVPKLTLTDSFGCRNFSLGADTIKVDTVIAGFTIAPNPVCVNSPVSFHDTSSSLFSSVNTWTWSIASGVTSTLTTPPAYTYTATGTYPVTMTVTDGIGCSKSITENVRVTGLPGPIVGPSIICNRLTSTYTDTASGGTWNSSNLSVATIGSATGILTASATGVTTLTYTLGSGCAVYRTVSVNPSPLPIVGSAGICTGTTTSLTDATSSGVWSSASPTVGTVSGTGTVAGIAAGTTTISYTVAGCPAVLVVTVSPAPGIIGGPGSVCAGSSITLTNTLLTGLWSTAAATASVNSTSGSVTGISGGTALISYVSGPGCLVTKTITVNPISPISGVSGLCLGATTTFIDGGGGHWSSSSTSVATIGSSSGLVSTVATGVTTITYLLSTGCSATTTLTVNAGPSNIAGPTSVCVGSSISLSDTAGGGLWTIAPLATAIIGSSSGLVTGDAAGVAIVTYSLGVGCTRNLTITVNPLPLSVSGANHVCLGATTSLADGTTGGAWSSLPSSVATIGTTGTVSGAGVGAAIITYTLPTGCSTAFPLTVNSLPASISGTSRVCIGLTDTLTDATPGGTWSSTPGTVATIGSSTGAVFGVGTGVATVDYIVGATGCAAVTTVTVNTTADSITGTPRVCIGNSTILSNPTPGGIWSSNDLSIATAGSSSGLISGITAGVTNITYSLGGGCTAVTSFTVNGHPVAITGTRNVCPGATDTLTDTPPGGLWTSSNSFIGIVGSSSGVVTGVSTGTFTVSYSLGAGCTSSEVITVNIAPVGIIAPSAICKGATATLYETTTGGTWSSGATGIATVTTGGSVFGVAGGEAAISYTISDGCSAIARFPVIAVPPITGLHNVCAWGDTATVHDSLAGGSFTSTLVTVSLLGDVLSYGPGTATITYTVPAGCFATAELTVNPLPGFITGDRSLCTGLTTTLADTTLVGVWTSGSIGVATVGPYTGVVTGVATGTAPITFTIPATGCLQTETVTVSALPSPLAGTANICVGTTTTLTDTTTGGLWSTSSSTIATVSGGLVSGVLAGDATITYTMGVGCFATRVITVDPLPAVYSVTGGGNYCASGTGVHIDLSGSQTGISYQLYYGGSTVGSPLTGTGLGLDFGLETTAGAYRVVATTTAGCTSTMFGGATINITPSVTPTVSINVTPADVVCAGTEVTLRSTITNGGSLPTYDWFLNGANTDSARSSYIYTPANGDVVFLTLTSNEPCAVPATVTSNAITITVDPELIPVVTIVAHPGTSITTGQADTLVASAINGGTSPTYQWEANGIAIPGATNATYTASNFTNGDSLVCIVTSSGPCGGHSANGGVKITVGHGNVGVIITSATGDNITVIPNPNKGEFTIKGSLASIADADVSVEMTDMLGQQVYKKAVQANNGKLNEKITLSNTVGNGVYLLTIRSGDETHIIHMVVAQ
jgi:PKD repeat protein